MRGWYIVLFCLFFIVMIQVYPTIFLQKSLHLHLEAAMIIGADEVPSHNFLHREEAYTKHPKIISPSPFNQEVSIIV